jgi:hypothetical protein
MGRHPKGAIMEADKPGYKRPPKATRFKQGHSGNPKGRPKGPRNIKCELNDELGEIISIKVQGLPKSVTKQRALIKAMMAKAVQGDTRAATLLINMMFRLLRPETIEETPSELSKEDQTILDAFVVRRRPLGQQRSPTENEESDREPNK